MSDVVETELQLLLTAALPAELMDIPILIWSTSPLSGNGNQLLTAVGNRMMGVMNQIPVYPLTVLPDPVATLYLDATRFDPGMSQHTRWSIFHCLAQDAMLTWSDLLPEVLSADLTELRASVDSLVSSGAMQALHGYLECSRAYLLAREGGAPAVLGLLDEHRWRLTLAQVRDLTNPEAVYHLDDYLRRCEETAAIAGRARAGGYTNLVSAAMMAPCELNRPDLLRSVLRRLSNLEMGVLVQLAVQCDLRYLGFLLYFVLSQTPPKVAGGRISPANGVGGFLRRLFLGPCGGGDGAGSSEDRRWDRALMVPRARLLVVDSMPQLAPSRRCGQFLAFTGAPSLMFLPNRNVFLAACAAAPAARARIGPDAAVQDVFQQQLGAVSLGAVVCFVDRAMQSRLDAGDEFVAAALGAVLARQQRGGLLVLWCLEGRPADLAVRLPGLDSQSVFSFAGTRQAWRVWRSLLRALDAIRYTGSAAAV